MNRAEGGLDRRRTAAWVAAVWLLLTALAGAQGALGGLGDRIRGEDPVGYWVYLPSVLLDGDLRLEDDLRAVYGPSYEPPATGTGRVRNLFAVGSALLWSPFFLLAHLLTLGANLAGAGLATDGAGPVYSLLLMLAQGLYGLGGALLLGDTLVRRWGVFAAVAAVAAVLSATPLTFDLWGFAPMSHTASFFAVALVLWTSRVRGAGWWSGLAVGLAFSVRWQDIVVGLVPLVGGLQRLRPGAAAPGRGRRLASFAGGVAAGAAPQLVAWTVLYGTPVTVPQGGSFLDPLRPELLGVLLSTRHGLLSWHPLLAAGVVGLVLLWRRDRGLAAAALLAFTLTLWVTASTADWWAGWSFGNRRFSGMLPLLGLGLAELASRQASGRRRAAVIAVVLAAAAWNQLFLVQYRFGLVPRAGKLTLAEMTTDKLRLPGLAAARDELLEAYWAWAARDLPSALALARRAERSCPPSWGADALRGLAALALGRWAEAEEALAAWSVRSPEEPLARRGLARARAELGDWEGAARALDGADDPDLLAVSERLAAREVPALDDGFWRRADDWLVSRVLLVDGR